MKQEFGNELFWGNNPEPLKNAKQDVMDLDFFVSITDLVCNLGSWSSHRGPRANLCPGSHRMTAVDFRTEIAVVDTV